MTSNTASSYTQLANRAQVLDLRGTNQITIKGVRELLDGDKVLQEIILPQKFEDDLAILKEAYPGLTIGIGK